MRRYAIHFIGLIVIFLFGCSEPYYATPELTLQKYVENRMMGSRAEYESCLNSFRKQDRKWWDNNWMTLCTKWYGKDCPGPGIPSEAAVWTDRFEPAGPNTTTIDSSEIDEENGVATLVVQGQEIEFVKERGNWKMRGFFGLQEELASQYPEIK